MMIIHFISGLEIEHGGPSYSVPMLNKVLNKHLKSVIYSVQTDIPLDYITGDNISIFKRSYYNIPFLAVLNFSKALKKVAYSADVQADIIHSHGLWRMPNIYAAKAADVRSACMVVSPRGMLSPVARRFSHLQKLGYWVIYQRRALKSATGFHATSTQELEEIRKAGFNQPVAVIPNGVSMPDLVGVGRGSENYVLSLGRIHPKKNLHTLIEAWARVVPDFPGWRLKIVGPDEGGYLDVLQRTVQRLGLNSVDFLGPVYDDDKNELMAKAGLFVLSTLSENFGNTVVESLACGVPVISTKGAPWSDLEVHGCGWWIDHGVDDMVVALRQALALPDDERKRMGKAGRLWVSQAFSWSGVGRQMAEFYKWLIEGGDRPSFVDLDGQ